jgi:nucleolar protein 56
MYIYTACFGSFVFNEHFKLKEKILFSKDEILKNFELIEQGKQTEAEKMLSVKYKVEKIDTQHAKFHAVLEFLRDYKKEFFDANLLISKNKIKNSVNEDLLIIQTIDNLAEIKKASNLLSKRLGEWYSYYFPELIEQINDNETFARLVSSKSKEELMKELNIKDSIGSHLEKDHLEPILNLAEQINSLSRLRQEHEKYLESLMNSYCKNLSYLAGYLIGGKLLSQAGSLKRLVLFPSSTIQLLGAEKALFRHMKTGARPPKYGMLMHHPFVQNAKKDEKGKAARALADKISIAVKMDYFKGEFIAPRLKKELEEKFK